MSDAKAPAAGTPPVVADLGRRGRKAIKKLRKGEGPLLQDAASSAGRAVGRHRPVG